MPDNTFHRSLIDSDAFAQYSLRASFFLRKLRGMRLWEAIEQVRLLPAVANGFPWDQRQAWGIDEQAWTAIEVASISPLLIFCHPRVIAEQPHLLLYYRTVALISQKGLASLVGGNIAKIEAGQSAPLSPVFLEKAVVALNSLISSLIETAAELRTEHLTGLQFASAGATFKVRGTTQWGPKAKPWCERYWSIGFIPRSRKLFFVHPARWSILRQHISKFWIG